MKKVYTTIIATVIILTFFDYYRAISGELTKNEVIQLIDGRITTLGMVLIVLFLFRKNLHFVETKKRKEENMIKNILIKHTYCCDSNIVVKTDKSIEEINKLIFLIQYIECDLPSPAFSDGIYQNDLKMILSDFYKMEVENYSNHEIDYEIDIHNNWELSGVPSLDEYKTKSEKLKVMSEQEKEDYEKSFKQDLYKSVYKEGLELYLIDFRLNQIKSNSSKDFILFSKIKKAILANDETFYWKGWCGRNEKINVRDFIYDYDAEIKH